MCECVPVLTYPVHAALSKPRIATPCHELRACAFVCVCWQYVKDQSLEGLCVYVCLCTIQGVLSSQISSYLYRM